MNVLRGMLVMFALSFCGPALADNFWLGVKAGTLGLGVEGTWRPLPWLDLRAGLNGYDYDRSGSEAGINYDATLALESQYATANFRFPLSPFRLTAGLSSNGNELRLVSRESGPIEVGGMTFSSEEVGTLQSLTSFDTTAPYAGVGLDFGLFGKVGLNLDVGVLFQGDPDITLTSDGALADDGVFIEALENERIELEDEVDQFKLYPVASLTFTVQFL